MTVDPRLFSLFKQGLEEVIPESALEKIATAQKPLKIKFGIDPSAPEVHLGHMVVLKKLRLLQEMGHQVIFLIGSFTAMIGDPTGKSETRRALTSDQVLSYAQTYQHQAFKILDASRTQVVYNAEWLDKLSGSEMIALAARYTVARMLERDDFHKRFTHEKSIAIHEFLYPLLQGYDSVILENDIEMGGTDQKFNLLMGRHLQKEYEKPLQACITTPILEGLDGVHKMSKSLGNHIGIMDSAGDQFGKIMSMPDELILRYFSLVTDAFPEEIAQMKADMAGGKNPKLLKEDLGIRLVTALHSKEAAYTAKEGFQRVFSQKLNPEEMPELAIPSEPIRLHDFLAQTQIAPSKKEATRLIAQQAVTLDGEVLSDPFAVFTSKPNQILKVGKRRFFKLI